MAGESGDDDDEDEEMEGEGGKRRWPVLRCMLVQVQIRENHQNGKDTHLRGLQIFAREKGGTGISGGGLIESRGAPSVSDSAAVGRRKKKKKKKRLPELEWDTSPRLR